jgi:hypothetical protein
MSEASLMGVRMALGQEPGHIRNMVLREGLRLIAIGTLTGGAQAGLTKHAGACVSAHRYGNRGWDVKKPSL